MIVKQIFIFFHFFLNKIDKALIYRYLDKIESSAFFLVDLHNIFYFMTPFSVAVIVIITSAIVLLAILSDMSR